MRYWYDTEFLDDGSTIGLISIGIVAEDGAEYYAVADDPRVIDRAIRSPWLRENVFASLPIRIVSPESELRWWTWERDHPDFPAVKPRSVIRRELQAFLLRDANPELWAWYAAYDHVALAQLWGPMSNLPAGIPMFTNDLRQECERLGNPDLPEQSAGEHNALADARHNRVRAEFLDHLAEAVADV